MAKAISEIPVYIPGTNRDWEKVQGLATITDDGSINIKLMNKGAAEWLVDTVKANLVIQCSLDYLMNQEMVDLINKRYGKKVI